MNKIKYIPIIVETPNIIISLTSTSMTVAGNTLTKTDQKRTNLTRGICWSTQTNPTTANNCKSEIGGMGAFTINIDGLQPETKYYYRAYVITNEGTVYGDERTITTRAIIPSLPTGYIPAGTFTMGSPQSESYRGNDETQHSVTLSAFFMSKYEITNAQFAAFLNFKRIGYSGRYTEGTYPSEPLIQSNTLWGLNYTGSQWISVAGYENNPAIRVSWYGAAEFATYVGGTLPTEAQWEYACRGGTSTPFNTGDFLTNLQANYNWAFPYNGGTNTVTIFPGKTQPVGSYAPNAYGLYDMHGNVREWCSDLYGPYPSINQTNPSGSATGSYRVIRGGSWNSTAGYCRTAFRTYQLGGSYDNGEIGFRVAFVP